MADAHGLAKFVEDFGAVTRSVIGHHPFDFDAEALVPGHRRLQKCHGAFLLFALQNLAKGDLM